MLLPATVVTLLTPHVYSVQDIVLPDVTQSEVAVASVSIEATREFTIEDVNPKHEAPAGVMEVENTRVALSPELVPVCSCESTGNPHKKPVQYKSNGEVLRGHVHSPDTGMCQINAEVWQDTAEELGHDIETKRGNIQMANYIYEEHGLEPWSASQHCWSEVLTVAE